MNAFVASLIIGALLFLGFLRIVFKISNGIEKAADKNDWSLPG